MVQLPQQPFVYHRPNLPAFDGLPMIDHAFCSALRVARTLGDDYATEGMDLEEVGLAHTMENLLYTIPLKCEAALGEHPTDQALSRDGLTWTWWTAYGGCFVRRKPRYGVFGCISVCDINLSPIF